MYFNCCLGQMFVSDVSDFKFVVKVEPYFLSDGEVVYNTESASKVPRSVYMKEVLIGRLCINGNILSTLRPIKPQMINLFYSKCKLRGRNHLKGKP